MKLVWGVSISKDFLFGIFSRVNIRFWFNVAYVVSCQGVVQLGGPDPWYNQGGLAKVGSRKSFLFSENSLVYEIKNTWLIWLLHYFSPSLSANKANSGELSH